jgi:hypothetical protein
MSQLARAPAAFTYQETNANKAAKAARNAQEQLYRNASAWNEPRRKAAYLAAFQQKHGRAPRNGLNYTLAEHEYNSMPPGVASSNNLVKLYQAAKKTRKARKNSRKATRRNRRSN